jgi:hypothetical protein
MKHNEIVETLNYLYPNSQWTLNDLELTWLEDSPKPTKQEINNGFIALQNWKNTKIQEEAEKNAAKIAILEKLGLTADEAAAILG